MSTRESRPPRGPAPEQSAKTATTTIPARGTAVVDMPRCEYAGVYCAVLGIPQLIAAGRARVCCRHYLDTDEDD